MFYRVLIRELFIWFIRKFFRGISLCFIFYIFIFDFIRLWGVLLVLVVSDCLFLFLEEYMYLKINKFLLLYEYLNMSKVFGFF